MLPRDRAIPHGIYLARHGQTQWSSAGRLQGQLDSPLTADGIAHAVGIGRAVEDAGVEVVCSSPLGRALRTAVIAAELLGADVVEIPELAELHHGAMAGLTRDEIAERFPDELEARAENRWGRPFPSGESYAGARGRARRALELCAIETDRAPLIITHEMIGRLLRAEMRGLSPTDALGLRHPHGVVFHIDHDAERLL